MVNTALDENPHAGNPQVRLNEGDGASCTAGVLFQWGGGTSRAACALVLVFVACLDALATLSPPARLIADPEHSLQWRTYCGNDGIRWSWPETARSAKLTVTGKDGLSSRVYTPPTSVFVPSALSASVDEDVVSLELAFYASDDANGDPLPGKTLTASGIGFVRGANGGATDFHSSDMTSRDWLRIKDRSAVLPVPKGTTALTIAGTAQTVEKVPGWILWSPIAASPVTTVTLTTDTADYETMLKCGVFGFLFYVR